MSKIAEIRNGYQFRGKVTPVESAGWAAAIPDRVVRVIQIKDIDEDRRLMKENLELVEIDVEPNKYEAREGDVLFLARGNRLFATAIRTPLHDAVATGYFFILRPKNDIVLPGYLAWYMNQPPFQAALRMVTKGTHHPLVARSDIEGLTIEIPPLATQEAIIALDDLRVKERSLLAALEEKRSQLVQALSLAAVRRTS